MAANWPITIEQGSTFSIPITIKNSDGTILDLTPWTGRGQIRRHYRSSVIVASFTCTNVVPLSSGRMIISMSAAITAGIPAGDNETDPRSEYFYDIEIENSVTTEVRRILNGKVYVSPEVTR